MTSRPLRRDRRVVALLALTALCYAIGYPLALIAGSPIGWVLVALGGPLLIAVGVVVVARVHASSTSPAPLPERHGTDDV